MFFKTSTVIHNSQIFKQLFDRFYLESDKVTTSGVRKFAFGQMAPGLGDGGTEKNKFPFCLLHSGNNGNRNKMNTAIIRQTEMLTQELRQPNIEGPLKQLYEQYFESIVAQICINGGNREDGADIFQEAVLVLVDKVQNGQFRGESSIKTFLSAIARNLWLHELRTRTRRNKRELSYMNKEHHTEEVSEKLEERQLSQQLLQVLDELGETCKKLLTGFYYEQKSMQELLNRFDYENDQVLRNRKSRCMKKLKELISARPELLQNLKSYYIYE
jgi:RNA polymerase sigma factor (sigma-70 family)